MKFLSFAALLLTASTSSATQELTQESFKDFKDSGANGMVKFFQSWCGHCMRMKPDWDKLAEESPGVVIADVDCGAEQDLCEEQDVRGYPTIKYWADGKEHKYEGGRSLEQLTAFVSEELTAKCTFDDAENCSEKAKKYIVKWSEKSVEDKKKEIERLEKMGTGSMKADLKKWIKERQNILKSGIAGADGEL